MTMLQRLNAVCRRISDYGQELLQRQSLGGPQLPHLDAPDTEPDWARPITLGGHQPRRSGETGETRPTPPSAGSGVQRPSQPNVAAPNPFAIPRPVDWKHPLQEPRRSMPFPIPESGEEFEVLHGKRLSDASLEDLFGAMLTKLDPDPTRQGIAETPARAAKAWQYWCSGYAEDVDALFKSFEDGAEGYDEMVIVHNIPVLSHCEHHLAAISGIAHVGYIPDGRVVGLSKLARVVDALSRRLQVQERLTVQVADAIERNLQPKGVGVVIKAAHGCMSSRGVRIHGSLTTTSALRGALHEGPARSEFLSLCASAERKLE